MATSAKPIRDLDREVANLLLAAADASGLNRRVMAAGAEMSMNRLGKILRQEPPPASIGEFGAIADVLGLSIGSVMAEAEQRIAERRAASALEARARDDAEVRPRSRGSWDELGEVFTVNHDELDGAEGDDHPRSVPAPQPGRRRGLDDGDVR